MDMNKFLFLVICGSFVLSGCAKHNKADRTVQPTPIADTTFDAEQRLASAAASISHSLEELAALEKAQTKHQKLSFPVDAKMIGLNQIVSIDWVGPVAPLVKKLAAAAHYKVKILGREPAIPPMISLLENGVTVADLLRNVNYQCTDRANVVIYPASHLIELRYQHD